MKELKYNTILEMYEDLYSHGYVSYQKADLFQIDNYKK